MNKEQIASQFKVDLTPSKEQYIRLLNLVMTSSTNDDDRAYAEAELERLEVGQ